MASASFNPSAGPISREESVYYGKHGQHLQPRGPGGIFRERRSKSAMLLWYGAEVEARIEATVLAAVEEIAQAAAEHARENHPWHNQYKSNFGEGLEANIFVGEPEITAAGIARCFWGAPAPALYLELGTVKMQAFPFLRPAQDATYPHLAGLTASRLVT